MVKDYDNDFFKEDNEDTTDFSLIKGDTLQQVEELEEELKENHKCTLFLHLLYNINKRLYLFEKGEKRWLKSMYKSLRFLKKKEESNTDFSLVKGALTENINRLEKLMNNSSSKYIQVKRKKKMHRAFSFVFLFNSKLFSYFFRQICFLNLFIGLYFN